MATPLSADRMVGVLRAEGVRVSEYRKWRTHSRNHKGAWGPVNGVMIHHTAGTGRHVLDLCYDGTADLPGPLCHAVGAKDGTVYLVGNGRANHAGLGDDDVLRAVISEAGKLPPDNEANTDGNARFYGIELVNMGDGKDPWPEAQVDAAARWAAGICRAHGWNERSVIGHKEWQPGKIDPTFDMGAFRARVRKLLASGPGKNPSPDPEEPDMPRFLSLAVKNEIGLTPGEWTAVPWDTEFSDPLNQHTAGDSATFATDCQVNGVASLRLRGLTPGAEFQARLVVMDDDGDIVQVHPIDERLATNGDTFMAMPFSGTVGDGRRFAVQVVHFGAEPATLHKSYLKAQVWPY